MTRPLHAYRLSRRALIAGGAAWIGAAGLARALDGEMMGVKPNATSDQSSVLQEAMLRAASEGRPLFLPAGTYLATNLLLPSNLLLQGVAGATVLNAAGALPVARIVGTAHVTLDGLRFAATAGNGPSEEGGALLEIETSDDISLRSCGFRGGTANGVSITDAAVGVRDCHFDAHGLAAIRALDSRGLVISGNRIDGCGNNGILIWGSKNRHDGSIVTANRVSRIGWSNGGNGQNGNGVNVFRCDDVVVANNQFSDCAFTSVRLNGTNNAVVSGNICRNSGEVAIFSEFAFTGSVIANNVIDGAATGISITNLDTGGRLATCTGNVVRNISAGSAVNPDTKPVGIFAEAETVISGNTVENVPGIGILAGYGPYLRNVAVSDNLVMATATGIAVSVVQDPAVGSVRVTGNLISGATEQALAGMEWDKLVSTDLYLDRGRYPHVTVGDNTVS